MSESSSVPENPNPSSSGTEGQIAAVLPLRDLVVFPHMIVPLFVGREKSVRALEEVMREEKQILLLTQKNAGEEDPSADGPYRLGTLATVLQLLKLPDQTIRVLVEGKTRARVKDFSPRAEFFQAMIEPISEQAGAPQEIEALVRSVKSNFESYIKLNKKVPAETLASVAQIDDPAKLADTVASHLTLKIADRQQLLETLIVVERLERIFALIEGEIGVLRVEHKIKSRVRRQMDKTQREYYLNEQLKAVQKELGEGEEGRDELAELEERIKKTKLSKEARKKATAEVKKLRSMSPMSPRSDRGAQLPRLGALSALGQEVQDREGHRPRGNGAQRRPFRSRQGQGTDSRISRGAAAHRQDEGSDLVPCGTAGRWQDIARKIDRARHGTRVRTHELGRRSRRSGNPWAPAHLYRVHAGQDHSVDEESESR
jgi:Lon protease-like protein